MVSSNLMREGEKTYLFLVIFHAILGVAIYFAPFLSKIYGFSIILYGLYYVYKYKNNDHEVLYVCAYMVGSEVILRMTDGNPVYEFSKYGVIFFMIMGMYYKGFSRDAIPYWIFLVLLIPSITISLISLDYDVTLRKSISFNISGPVELGIASLYTYNRKITLEHINKLMLAVGLPIITCTAYLIFYTPNIKDVITGTGSSFETSGGFGPNQVATMLGLGMFVFFSRLIFSSGSKLLFLVNLIVIFNISYRGLVTFSRGGMITGLLMLIIFIVIVYQKLHARARGKFSTMMLFFGILMVSVWLYTANETSGLIENRYANQDAKGRVKESQLSGRENIMQTEIDFFLENPVFGIGVARSAVLRGELYGKKILTHNEITRLLSEHGSLGIMALLILFFTPLILYLDNRNHIYLLCFLLFWLLTINHAAMRLAAPGFIYALSILKVTIDEEHFVHRE